MKVKLTFKYDGSKFNGFQRQNDVRSVQKALEEALSKIYEKDIQIKGAGRTDTGVHANGQVCHYECNVKISNLKNKINLLVNPDIYIDRVKYVSDDFHARLSAKKKEYIYKINLGLFKSSYNDYFYQPRFKLDIGDMRDAAKLFIGTHDFRNFVSGERDNFVSTVYSITFTKVFDKLEVRFVGSHFYRYMIRNMMGALLEVGKYSIKRDVISSMLEDLDTPKTLPTAPACGLYLNKIWY